MNKISIETATQLNQILSFLPESIKIKIPIDIWKRINDKTDSEIFTKINNVSDIKIENMLPETRKYLSFIFLKYLATEEERNEYLKILKNNEKQYQNMLSKKYDIDNIFDKNIHQSNIKQENSNLPVERKEKLFQIILNKLRKFFQKK